MQQKNLEAENAIVWKVKLKQICLLLCNLFCLVSFSGCNPRLFYMEVSPLNSRKIRIAL